MQDCFFTELALHKASLLPIPLFLSDTQNIPPEYKRLQSVPHNQQEPRYMIMLETKQSATSNSSNTADFNQNN